MTTVSDIRAFLNTLAPETLAESWDNVGLLCGRGAAQVKRILVALDPFEDVCAEAAERGAQLIVTHHPLIFFPAKSVTDDSSVGRCIQILCAHGISAVNAHTNLDIADGGVNDVLADTLGLSDVTVIGNGHLLRRGIRESSLPAFLAHVKTALGCEGLRYCDGGNSVRRIAVGGGACADLLPEVLAAGCDTFVTSDVKYNGFWDARDQGISLIDAGHFYTENPVVFALANKIRAAFPEIVVEISQKHRDCMKFF